MYLTLNQPQLEPQSNLSLNKPQTLTSLRSNCNLKGRFYITKGIIYMALGEEEMLGIWLWIEFNLSEVRQNYKDREENVRKS